MSGKSLRLEKLFSKEENAVIVAIDHGEFDGPIPGLIDMDDTMNKINPCIDGVLLSPGMLKNYQGAFNFKGAPLPIVRLNWSTVYCFHWKTQSAFTVPAISVKDAIVYGAEIVLASLTLKTGSEELDARNVEVFCKLKSEADKYGIPFIGEFFPINSDSLTPEEMQEQVYSSCRILAELGADVIKTFYTKEFKSVTNSTPVPILGLGAEKKPTQLEALQLAQDEILDGARGVVFGRNAIQVENPYNFQAALCEVVKRGMAPEKAINEFKLRD